MRNLLSIILALFATIVFAQEQNPAARAPDTVWQTELAGLARLEAWHRNLPKLPEITSTALDQAIEAARFYILAQQSSQGNFRYAMDITDPEFSDTSDNAVRQAGTLWSICNLNRDRFTEPTRQACLLSIDFFIHNTRPLPNSDQKVVTYKAQRKIKTGMVALFCLALTDFIDGQEKYMPADQLQQYRETLEQNLRFLQSQERPDGFWNKELSLEEDAIQLPPGELPPTSPYYNGEALLAYLFAIRYYKGHPEITAVEGLEERVHMAVPKLLKFYAVDSLKPDGDSSQTKGFFQWGLMSCALYHDLFPSSPNTPIVDNAALALSWWQIYNNRMDTKNGNTAYAIEGLVAAWHIAHENGRSVEAKRLRNAIEDTLCRLMSWQVGGPFEQYNPFLMKYKDTIPQAAYGGVTDRANSGYIRIDNVQHQLHAMLLARKYLWP